MGGWMTPRRLVTIGFAVWCAMIVIGLASGDRAVEPASLVVEGVVAYAAMVVLSRLSRGGMRPGFRLVVVTEADAARRKSRRVAYALTGLCIAWEAAVVIVADGSWTWLTYFAAAGVVPVGVAVASVLHRR